MANLNNTSTQSKKNTAPLALALDEESTDPVNDYSSAPKEVSFADQDVRSTLGSSTGDEENALQAGGWEGTDDATSTAPSDFARPPAPVVHGIGESENEDPTGRAYAGGLDPEDGGVVDLAGRPVEEGRDWEQNPVDLEEKR